ncbi:hypothetical protein HPB49_021634 [Dermacentor silvarum]|uniref:Uncharacterized protein n=1 Tax=Dermacentor silvarum TaxID=543639 RepID=A0ACB8C5M1_DERSI|nr:hypothetical protein HPB49_021634 [Dermacentor silvarum]
MRRAALASEAHARSAHVGRQPSAADWSIRKECKGPLDVFFMVFSEASDWNRRADIRDTLLADLVKKTFKWAGAFVLQEPWEPLVAKWIEVEGDTAGDLIVLPPSARNASANASDAFHKAARWALEYCAEACYVIKLADDTAVHPVLLYKFLRRTYRTGMGAVHCDTSGSTVLPPSTDVAGLLAVKAHFFAGGYDMHCRGLVVLASLKLLKDLDRALLTEGSETASVPSLSQRQDSHLWLQISNVAVGRLSDISFDSTWNCAFVKLRDTSMRRLDRYALWYFTLWKDVVGNKPRLRELLRGVQHRNGVSAKGVQI